MAAGRQTLLILLSVVLLLNIWVTRAVAQVDSDVTFETIAMTYPYDKKVKIPIIGTERFAKNIKGEATIERRKSVTLVQINIGRLPPPSQLSPAVSTYVIWAITPEGVADNLGEYRQRDNETLDNWLGSEISTSTPHQTFSLIITAEPHFLVSAPSRLVVVANQGGRDAGLSGVPNRISFSGDSDFEHVLVSPEATAARKDNKYPVELVEAHRALDIARYYEGETLAANLFDQARLAAEKADRLYLDGNREGARETGIVAIRIADQARRLAVSRKKAEQLREQINEKDELITRLEDDVRGKAQSTSAMQADLEDEKRRRRAIEQENERLLRDLELARREVGIEKDSRQMDRTILSRLENENQQMREQLEKVQKNAQVAERERQLREQREQVLSKFEQRRENRGTVLILPDAIFDGEQSTSISAEGSFKLEPLATLLKQTTNNIIIESFTDNHGTQDARFKFSQARAKAIVDYLVMRGVAGERIQFFANGGSSPRTDNRTPQGRAANRRVELLLVEAATPGAN